MSEGDQSRELIAYIRERDEARAELKKLQTELSTSKSKLYDANSKVSELQEQLKSLKDAGKNTKSGGKPVENGKVASNNLKAPAKKGAPKSPTPQPKATSQKAATSEPAATATVATPGDVRHPPITGKEELSANTYLYYTEISKILPDIKIQTLIEAEKKFNLADINKDGVIDQDELDKVLANNVTIFTPAQVEEIIKEIDQDNNGTLEFIEVLMILDKMSKRRSKLANLPASIQDNQTKVCSIQ